MDIMDAVRERHSVRKYTDKPIEGETLHGLLAVIDECNRESGLHIQLVKDEKAFDCLKARYGRFSGVANYIALVGKDTPELYELVGYYGEKIVIRAQMLGLSTCWVAGTYKKIPGVFDEEPEEKLTAVISVGYGANKGVQHRSKKPEKVAPDYDTAPEWFRKGVDAALLAPTAINQQKFVFRYNGGKVSAQALRGPYSMIDLGIVKYHFEIGSGKGRDIWE